MITRPVWIYPASGVPSEIACRSRPTQVTRRVPGRAQKWALDIARRSTMRKARVALARRLAIIMYAMLGMQAEDFIELREQIVAELNDLLSDGKQHALFRC